MIYEVNFSLVNIQVKSYGICKGEWSKVENIYALKMQNFHKTVFKVK